MDILVDENIPLASVEQLHEMGHDVLDIRGTPDEAMKLFSPEKWSGLLVVMRDKAMSTWRRSK